MNGSAEAATTTKLADSLATKVGAAPPATLELPGEVQLGHFCGLGPQEPEEGVGPGDMPQSYKIGVASLP